VHRPKYDDWSFPKGKLDPGEDHETAALREVEEETGLRCRLYAPLGTLAYRDGRGRRKEVRYWAMEVVDGDFSPNREVDELRWLDPDAARELLSYPHDAELVARLPGETGPARADQPRDGSEEPRAAWPGQARGPSGPSRDPTAQRSR
jgi:8-oxo-dGTP diphosphatase